MTCVPYTYVCTHLTTFFPVPSYFVPPPPIFLLKMSKTFQAFSSLYSSSKQIEKSFLNDPLIIGSGVALVFQLCLCAFLPPTPLSHPLYLSQVFKGLFFLLPSPLPPHTHLHTDTHIHTLLPPEWLFSPFVCAHEVECRKVSKSIFFPLKKENSKPSHLS